MDPVLEIKMVWENLALAMALWAGTKKGLITRGHLPTGRAVVPSDDGMLLEIFNPLELKSDQELARCINNQIRGAVTFSAIQTHNTLTQVFRTPPLLEADPDLRAARCVILLLNNTLSQGMLAPVWSCPEAYRSSFAVRPISFVLDASALDGKPVFWEDFGGLTKYLDLLQFCAERLEQPEAEPDPSPGEAVGASKNRQDQLAMEIPEASSGDEPVAAFVETRCVVDSDARAPAKDLYAQYLEWCQDAGRNPLAQRSFGIQLTKLGFVRKRRGRGRHWWEGVEPAGAPAN